MKKKVFYIVVCVMCIMLSGCTSSTVDEEDNVKNEDNKVTIEEVLLYDKDDITLVAKEYDDSYGVRNVKISIENNSEKDIRILPKECSVNDFMIDADMLVNIPAGEQLVEPLILPREELEKAKIENITNITVSFIIVHDNTDRSYTELASIDTSLFGEYTQVIDDSGIVMYDENDIKVVSKGIVDIIGGQALELYIENNTGETIQLIGDEIFVNGIKNGTESLSLIFKTEISPFKKAIGRISFQQEFLDNNKIESIENMNLNLKISNDLTGELISAVDKIFLEFE